MWLCPEHSLFRGAFLPLSDYLFFVFWVYVEQLCKRLRQEQCEDTNCWQALSFERNKKPKEDKFELMRLFSSLSANKGSKCADCLKAISSLFQNAVGFAESGTISPDFNRTKKQEQYLMNYFKKNIYYCVFLRVVRGMLKSLLCSALFMELFGTVWLEEPAAELLRRRNLPLLTPLENHNSICSVEANKGMWPSGRAALKHSLNGAAKWASAR